MSDFLLDFRPAKDRNPGGASSFLRYYPDIKVIRLEEKAFTLVLALSGDPSLLCPYRRPDGKVLIALVGMSAIEDRIWEEAEQMPGEGGLACKAIYSLYMRGGIRGLSALNGSYIALVFDADLQKFFLVSDRCGQSPLFMTKGAQSIPVFSSHPDLLASSTMHQRDYDNTSLCEFIATGHVSFPFTYYRDLSAADFASIHSVSLKGELPSYEGAERYFQFNYRPSDCRSKADLVERLSAAVQNAVRRRTDPRLGGLAVGLSGGLDSRMILCACPDPSRVSAFCFFDEQNLEYDTARAIAEAVGVTFMPLKRDFEHYGSTAEAGIRITGGMSSFSANHLLGFRQDFRAMGIQNILSGVYCDYLFKGLGLSRKRRTFSVNEAPAAFDLDWYLPFYPVESDEGHKVETRLERMFPAELRKSETDASRLEVEYRRLFPLCYEPESIEEVVPEKVLGWNTPMIDSDVLDVYLTVAPRLKLDHSVYSQVVRRICGSAVSRIPNANTGTWVGASTTRQLWHRSMRGIKKRCQRRSAESRLLTPTSWQNFGFYVQNSRVLREAWDREDSEARELFSRILGYDPFLKQIGEYRAKDWHLTTRLLTVKIWLGAKRGL